MEDLGFDLDEDKNKWGGIEMKQGYDGWQRGQKGLSTLCGRNRRNKGLM